MQHIVYTERLGQRNLHARQQIAQHRAGRKTQNNTANAGGSQQAATNVAHAVKGHQGAPQAYNHNQDIEAANQKTGLCFNFSGTFPLVLQCRVEYNNHIPDGRGAAHRRPGHRQDQQQRGEMLQLRQQGKTFRCGFQNPIQHQQT